VFRSGREGGQCGPRTMTGEAHVGKGTPDNTSNGSRASTITEMGDDSAVQERASLRPASKQSTPRGTHTDVNARTRLLS
jgi:hypothetical protein